MGVHVRTQEATVAVSQDCNARGVGDSVVLDGSNAGHDVLRCGLEGRRRRAKGDAERTGGAIVRHQNSVTVRREVAKRIRPLEAWSATQRQSGRKVRIADGDAGPTVDEDDQRQARAGRPLLWKYEQPANRSSVGGFPRDRAALDRRCGGFRIDMRDLLRSRRAERRRKKLGRVCKRLAHEGKLLRRGTQRKTRRRSARGRKERTDRTVLQIEREDAAPGPYRLLNVQRRSVFSQHADAVPIRLSRGNDRPYFSGGQVVRVDLERFGKTLTPPRGVIQQLAIVRVEGQLLVAEIAIDLKPAAGVKNLPPGFRSGIVNPDAVFRNDSQRPRRLFIGGAAHGDRRAAVVP